MLIQFAVENFLSFRDKTVLSMVASDDTRHPSHVVTLPDGTRILRCAALYGANASGKSNLLMALAFARELIAEGIRPGKPIPVKPFKLRAPLQTKAKFEFELWLNYARFSYGIVLDARTVHSEWLYRADVTGERMIFEREQVGREARVKLGEEFVGSERMRMELFAQNTRPEQPFVTEAEEKNVPWVIGPWFRREVLLFPSQFALGEDLPEMVHNHPELGKFLAAYLQGAGTGITDLRVEREEHKEQESFRLVTQRHLPGGQSVEFELEEESDGTQRLMDLLPLLFITKRKSAPRENPLLAIDELERSLHPVLTRQFLREYLQSSDRAGQLLFTTHDTDLLDLGLLRPDEIWFAEKDSEHASRLYSLSEFKADQLAQLGDRLEDGYLNGRFGAIPFLGTRQQLGLPVPPATSPAPTAEPVPPTDSSK